MRSDRSRIDRVSHSPRRGAKRISESRSDRVEWTHQTSLMGSIIARVSDADHFSAVSRPPQFFDPLSSRKFRQWFAHTSLFLRTMNCLAYAPSSVLLFVVCIMQNANESEPEFTSRVTAHDSFPTQILLLYSVTWQIPLNLMLLLFVFHASIFFVNLLPTLLLST